MFSKHFFEFWAVGHAGRHTSSGYVLQLLCFFLAFCIPTHLNAEGFEATGDELQIAAELAGESLHVSLKNLADEELQVDGISFKIDGGLDTVQVSGSLAINQKKTWILTKELLPQSLYAPRSDNRVTVTTLEVFYWQAGQFLSKPFVFFLRDKQGGKSGEQSGGQLPDPLLETPTIECYLDDVQIHIGSIFRFDVAKILRERRDVSVVVPSVLDVTAGDGGLVTVLNNAPEVRRIFPMTVVSRDVATGEPVLCRGRLVYAGHGLYDTVLDRMSGRGGRRYHADSLLWLLTALVLFVYLRSFSFLSGISRMDERRRNTLVLLFVRTFGLFALTLSVITISRSMPHLLMFLYRATLPLDNSQVLDIVRRALEFSINWANLAGGAYRNFFAYIFQPLVLLIIASPLLLVFGDGDRLRKDKYTHLALMPLHLTAWSDRRSRAVAAQLGAEVPLQQDRARTAIYAILVKLFFGPVLCSWTIQGIFDMQAHFNNWESHGKLDWDAAFQMFVTVLILIDTLVFAFSYWIEHPRLKNEIRSVDRTFLGLFFCLICYPPFHNYAFSCVDYPLWGGSWQITGVGKISVQMAILVLWAIYTSATCAMGWKASNLTNRGTVSRGPYRYVRHPAYAAKFGVWLLEGVFLGQRTFFVLCALCVVYALRAFTEERHLLQDEEYRRYASEVKWRFIPRVF